MRVLLVQNSPVEDFARYRVALEDLGHRCRVLRPDAGDGFPALDAMDAVLVGGTPTPAAEFEGHPRLRKEWAFLSRALAEGKPCLGVGCGAQVLSRVMGAATRPLPAREIGVFEARKTKAGATDRLFQGFPAEFPVFQWRRDALEAPKGTAPLVEQDPGQVQAFRRGNAAGVLFHLECAPRDVLRWTNAYANELAEAGVSAGRVMGDVYAKADAMKPLATLLVRNFCALAEGGGVS